MKTRLIAILSTLPLMALGSFASAQTDLTCADIDFTSAVISVYPDIAEACQDVVEIDGERFAKIGVEVLRSSNNSASGPASERPQRQSSGLRSMYMAKFYTFGDWLSSNDHRPPSRVAIIAGAIHRTAASRRHGAHALGENPTPIQRVSAPVATAGSPAGSARKTP